MGAGAVGCYHGGYLQAAGVNVTFVGRPTRLNALQTNGLTLTSLGHSQPLHLAAENLTLHTDVPADCRPALVLLCTKSGGTAQAARALQAVLPTGTLVLSLQNGLSNVPLAQAEAPDLPIIPGMVPYNVAEVAPGHFHRGTQGQLSAQDTPALRAWQPWFDRAGLPLTLHHDLTAVQWSKLLLNLNNPVNALSGQGLRAQLLEHGYRELLACLMDEALVALKAARQPLARVTPLPPQWLPGLLRLPTPLFRVAAARMLKVDDQARSSMADDMANGRPTEIDALCGEVVRLADQCGTDASLNLAMVSLVKAWEGKHPYLSPGEMRAALRARCAPPQRSTE